MLGVVLDKSSKQHVKQKIYCHLSLIRQTIQVGEARHAKQCWRSKSEFISDVLLWNPTHGQTRYG